MKNLIQRNIAPLTDFLKRVLKRKSTNTKCRKSFARSFTPARFIPIISMLVRDRKSAFENDMIYVKGACHDVREMAPSREKGIFSTHAHTLGASGECSWVGRKDRYHLSIPLKRPRDSSPRASERDRLYSLIPAETSAQPSRLGQTYESQVRRYPEFDCRSRFYVNNRALLVLAFALLDDAWGIKAAEWNVLARGRSQSGAKGGSLM